MKKKFTFLMVAIVLLTMMVLPGKTWAETSTVTASKINSSSVSWKGSANETWSVTVNGGATNQNVNNGYAQVGTSSNPSTSITFSTSGISGTISSIVVNCAAYKGKAKISATVGGSAFGTQSQSVPSWSSNTGGDVTFSGSASGAIVITMTNDADGRAMYIKSITVTYTTGGSPVDPTITFDNGNVYVGKTLDLSTLFSSNSSGAVTYSITSGNTYASITDNVITGVAEGSVTVEASQAATASYNAKSVSATITVTPYVQPTEFDIDLNNSLFGTSYSGSVAGITDDNPVEGTQDNVSVTYAGGGNHYINDSQIRFYPSNKLTFDAPTGYMIKKIVFTASSWEITVKVGEETISSSTKTWEGKASRVVFDGSGSNGNCQMTKATITIAAIYDITYASGLSHGAFAGSGNPITSIAGNSITVNTEPESGYHLATLTYNDGTSHNATVSGNSGSFTMPAHAVEVSATFEQDETYTITFVENGETVNVDDDIPYGAIGNNLPDSELGTLPANLEFVGWVTESNLISTYITTEPELVTQSYNVNADVTFYAVYKYDYSYTTGGGTPTWTKVTDASTLAAGDQLVIASDGGATSAVAGEIQTASSPYMASVDAEFGTSTMTTLPNDAIVLTLGGSSGSWTLTNSNRLLGSSGAKMKWNDGTTTWSISISNGDATIGVSETERFLYNVNSPRFKTYTSSATASMILPQLYRLEGGSTTVNGTYYLTSVTEHSSDVTVSNATTWTGNHSVDAFVTITSAGKLTVDGLLINPEKENLIIQNGGQIVCSNDAVKATFKKSIARTNESNGIAENNHWYTISSPVNNVEIKNVTNLVDSETAEFQYNLYRYNESENEWEAYNLDQSSQYYHADFKTLENGRGYLYRNYNINNTIDIEFAGVINVGDVENIALTKDNKGFNLIGNPFGHSIAKGTNKAIDSENLSTGCYALTNSGTWTSILDDEEIKPNQGVLIETSTDVDDFQIKDINYVAQSANGKYNNDNIKFIVENAEYSDAAYAWFDKVIGLTKINHRNDRAPMLYIPQDGHNYAIASMSDNTKVFGLNFKSPTMGQYTLRYKATGEYNYIHVIDRLTGEDVDMLLEGEYSFIATPNDNENRFIVKLEYMPDYSEGNNEMFAYQTGSEILVSGSGELQIFDVTGRNVMTATINGAESISVPAQGVYIFRLVGNEIKTQKIVVR